MTTTQGEAKLIMLNTDLQPKRDKTHSPTTPQQCGMTFQAPLRKVLHYSPSKRPWKSIFTWLQLKAGPNNMTVLTVYTVHILVAILPCSQHSLNAVHIWLKLSPPSLYKVCILSLLHSIVYMSKYQWVEYQDLDLNKFLQLLSDLSLW